MNRNHRMVINGIAVQLRVGDHTGWIFALVDRRELGPFETNEEAMAAVAVEVERAHARRMAHSAA